MSARVYSRALFFILDICLSTKSGSETPHLIAVYATVPPVSQTKRCRFRLFQGGSQHVGNIRKHGKQNTFLSELSQSSELPRVRCLKKHEDGENEV